MQERPATRIVIIGAGYAGAYCAAALERSRAASSLAITVIDPNNYFVIYPLLVEAGVGSLEPRHPLVSTRSFLRRSRFIMAHATGVDFERRVVSCRVSPSHGVPGYAGEFGYDHLILAPGSVTRLPDVPGLREHGFEVKSLADAVSLRDRVIRLMERADAVDDPDERARLLHLVVVGANFTGVEVAGEFHEFLQRLSRRYPNLRASDVRITLIELAPRILSALGEELADFAARSMRKRGIDIRTEETVAEIHADHVVLRSGERLEARTCIWCAGIAPNPLVARLDLPADNRGYVLCERDCRVKGFDNVWSIGDCAVNIDAEGRAYPATAQHAVREGRHVAKQITRLVRGEPTRPFDYASQGSIAALGCRTGVAEIFGVRLSGFSAWWLWRTIYLLKMPGLGRKMRIAIDWTLDLLFPRDDVQLGVHRARRSAADDRSHDHPTTARECSQME